MMNLSPKLYHWIIRPRWLTKKYIHDHIEEHFELGEKSILDFGCGTGANSSICNCSGYLGIDPDSDRIKLAKKFYPNHQFENFDMNRIPSQDRTFDYVLALAVLHHIPNTLIAEYLKEFARILKPGGKVIVMEPFLCENHPFNNRFMQWYDAGEYIRKEEDYVTLFQSGSFECTVLKKFTKCMLYNELFFLAEPNLQLQ